MSCQVLLEKLMPIRADRTSFSLAIFPRYKVNFPADINLVTASGARVAGLPERYLPIISEFGNCLGQCYQIADDLLDVSSTFRGSKEPFMDIQESKSTIVLIHLLNHACAYDKQKVIEILHKERHTKTKAEVDLVVSLMDEYGSIEYTRQEAQRWSAQALDVLNQKMSFFDDVAQEKLEWAIDFVVGRTF
jgi:geranylgeranyl pyrophosphate synthase